MHIPVAINQWPVAVLDRKSKRIAVARTGAFCALPGSTSHRGYMFDHFLTFSPYVSLILQDIIRILLTNLAITYAMNVFANTNAAPFTPSKTPYKSTTIRIPKNDALLARQPRSNLLCAVCDNPGHLKCSACHSMRYCSAECQQLDRNTHKIFCKSFERFTDDKRPSPQHIRAILFPEHKKKPEWKWVLSNEDRTAVCLSHMYERLNTDGLAELTPVMYMSCTIKRVAQHWLFSLTLKQSYQRKSTSVVNQSVMNLGPPGHLMLYWGPILVVGGMPEMAPSAQYPKHPMVNLMEDVTMNDTYFVIEAMLYGDHDSPCVVDVPRYSRSWKSLPGLKVNCLGDRYRVRFYLPQVPMFNILQYS